MNYHQAAQKLNEIEEKIKQCEAGQYKYPGYY